MSFILDYLKLILRTAAAYVAGFFQGRAQKEKEAANEEAQAWEDRQKVADYVNSLNDDLRRQRLREQAAKPLRGVEEDNPKP